MPDDAHDVDLNEFPEVPPNLRTFIENVGFAIFENMPEDDLEVFNEARHGRCMTCKGPLGNTSNFIINRYGIVGGYCGGQCHSDMAVLGFVQEAHHDIMSSIKFRGGMGDSLEDDDGRE